MSEKRSMPDPSPVPNRWLPTALGLAVAVLVLGASGVLTWDYLVSRPLDLRGATLAAAATLETGLVSNRVPESNIRATGEVRTSSTAAYHYLEYDVTVPRSLDAEQLQSVLRRQLQKDGVTAMAVEGGQGEPMLELVLAGQPFGYVRLSPQPDNDWNAWPTVEAPKSVEEKPHQVDGDVALPEVETSDSPESDLGESEEPPSSAASMAPPESSAVQSQWTPPPHLAAVPASSSARFNKQGGMRVAIILDDGGYGGDTTERVLSLDPRLTLSILPYTPYAASTAERARNLGFEVMLHMPMENVDADLDHEGQLDIGMSPATVEALTLRALDEVPAVVGVNNHMGSKFTSDSLHMDFFLDAIADTGLYFVDSRTAADSRAYDLAVESGIPAAYRNVFLDHDNDAAAIARQFDMMMKMAEETGSVVAIAHFRPTTVEVLERLLPTLAPAGIELVHVSELVQ